MLTEAGIDDAALDAKLLLAHVLGWEPRALSLRGTAPWPAALEQPLAVLLARRAAREPTHRILGQRGFWTIELGLNAACLEPRPDSETLIAALVEATRPTVLGPGAPSPSPLVPDGAYRVLDLGTGPGTLLLALLDSWPGASGLGVDRALAATQQARINAAALGLGMRAQFAVMDWGAGLAQSARFDVVIANPPYITTAEMLALAPEVAGFDPPLALAGGDDGLRDYPVIAALARRHLAPGGRLLLEHGHQQRGAVAAIVQAAGFERWAGWDDFGGRPRAVMAWAG